MWSWSIFYSFSGFSEKLWYWDNCTTCFGFIEETMENTVFFDSIETRPVFRSSFWTFQISILFNQRNFPVWKFKIYLSQWIFKWNFVLLDLPLQKFVDLRSLENFRGNNFLLHPFIDIDSIGKNRLFFTPDCVSTRRVNWTLT